MATKTPDFIQQIVQTRTLSCYLVTLDADTKDQNDALALKQSGASILGEVSTLAASSKLSRDLMKRYEAWTKQAMILLRRCTRDAHCYDEFAAQRINQFHLPALPDEFKSMTPEAQLEIREKWVNGHQNRNRIAPDAFIFMANAQVDRQLGAAQDEAAKVAAAQHENTGANESSKDADVAPPSVTVDPGAQPQGHTTPAPKTNRSVTAPEAQTPDTKIVPKPEEPEEPKAEELEVEAPKAKMSPTCSGCV
ncbi:hypothetical protein CC86DRAFT_115433 [Ophiobolus disseminans]|uniref:Uncharacterized protein n=1 Tax=Ophiobolus disseminans TaxID=1469910 RepID=A0A6A6ZIN2_9PLEO|nr:hypothetical protein CC86DRAFT_115433 [Ophiobolus disseminans]